MPKRSIEWIQGGYYHIYNRGSGRQHIFRTEENYLYLLRLMKQVSAECNISVLAYCLLPNHYHWLVRQDGSIPGNLLPKRVFGSYSQAFNRYHKRTGGLFEGPYKARMVTSDEYLRQVCVYIHANPVHHGVVKDVKQWPYSNVHEFVGDRNGTLFDEAFLNRLIGSQVQYAAFLQSQIDGEVALPYEIE